MESVKAGVWNAAAVAFANTNEREVGACHVAEAASVCMIFEIQNASSAKNQDWVMKR